MQKILVTGSNGLVGQKFTLLAAARPEFTVLATSRSPSRLPSIPNCSFAPLDITNPEQVRECFEAFRPGIVLHTAAMTQVDLCESKREDCRKVNVEGTRNLLNESQKYGSKFIYLSTDFIFDGTDGPYREDAVPNPVNYYGKSKLEAEKLVQNSGIPWTILRTVLIYGILPVMPRPNLVTLVKNKLEKKEVFRVVNDQFRTPTLAEDLATACLNAALKDKQGIYHISGNELVSIYEFALKIAEAFRLDKSLFQTVSSAVLNEPARRPPKTGLIIEKAVRELDYRPHSLAQGLDLVREQALLYNSPLSS